MKINKKIDMTEVEKKEGVSIEDFVIRQKIDAFCESYVPEETEQDAEEIFNDSRLRKYFQAYPRNIGDPLIAYINILEREYGFRMHTGISGEPVIFASHKPRPYAIPIESL